MEVLGGSKERKIMTRGCHNFSCFPGKKILIESKDPVADVRNPISQRTRCVLKMPKVEAFHSKKKPTQKMPVKGLVPQMLDFNSFFLMTWKER